jgi:cytochrome c
MKNFYHLFTVVFCLSSSISYASGDAKLGEQQYVARCIACHSIEANLAGPMHRGVFGRMAGKAAGYDFSPALKQSNVTWTEKTLDKWLANPEKFIPGQQMGYSVTNARDRADLIAFLKTQSTR